MTSNLYRQEPGRFQVVESCKGSGTLMGSGAGFRFKGVDVSRHGFGCIISTQVQTGDLVEFEIFGEKIVFEVMWAESHLGIENMFRVGLITKNRNLNIHHFLTQHGLIQDQSPSSHSA